MADVGILGGTFNPPHNGHIRLAGEFREKLSLDKILLIPTYTPPHKQAKELASAEDRLNMCSIIAEATDFLEVSDIEINRGGKSYTVDTLRELKKRHPENSYFFLMGSDMFLTFHLWREYREIFSLCTLCVASRENGSDYEKLIEYAKETFGENWTKVKISPLEPMELSSTEVREALHKGEGLSGLVPEKIEEYITERGLYR